MSVLKIKDNNNDWVQIPTIKGETGDAAGFGTVTATVDANHGTPSVSVTATGDDTAKNFAFAFSNLQPAPYDDSVLVARMDSFTNLAEGSTTGDAELIDGRTGADGVTYTNIGGAIRGQVTDLKSDIRTDIEPFYQSIQFFDKTKWGADGTFWDTSQNPPTWVTTGGSTWHGYPKLSLKKGWYRMSSDTSLAYCAYVKNGVVVPLTYYAFEVDGDFDLYISYTGDKNSAVLYNSTEYPLNNDYGVYDTTLPFASKNTVYFAIGDSITHANHTGIPTVADLDPFCPKGGTQGVAGWKSMGYPYFISKKLGLNWYNYGVGGSTLTDCTVNGEHHDGFMTPNGRYTQLDNSVTPKYISIFFGWNDGNWGQYQEAEKWLKETYGDKIYYPMHVAYIGTTHADGTPYATQAQYDACNAYSETINGQTLTGLDLFYEKFIGEIDSTDVTKFYGAYNVLLEYLILKYPYAKIMPIVPYNNYVYNPYIVKLSLQEAVRKVSERWGLAYFDFDSKEHQMFCGTGWYDNNFKTTTAYANIRDYRIRTLLADGLHPNLDGYRYMANMIGAKLITI